MKYPRATRFSDGFGEKEGESLADVLDRTQAFGVWLFAPRRFGRLDQRPDALEVP